MVREKNVLKILILYFIDLLSFSVYDITRGIYVPININTLRPLSGLKYFSLPIFTVQYHF